MKHKTNLIFLTIISYFMSFNLNAQNIHIKCKRFSDDERSKLIEACKKSCSFDYIRAYSGSNQNEYITSKLYFDYNMFGGIRPKYDTDSVKCQSRCEAEVDLFIKSHCDGYEVNVKELVKEVIKALPNKVIGKLYDPNLIYE